MRALVRVYLQSDSAYVLFQCKAIQPRSTTRSESKHRNRLVKVFKEGYDHVTGNEKKSIGDKMQTWQISNWSNFRRQSHEERVLFFEEIGLFWRYLRLYMFQAENVFQCGIDKPLRNTNSISKVSNSYLTIDKQSSSIFLTCCSLVELDGHSSMVAKGILNVSAPEILFRRQKS